MKNVRKLTEGAILLAAFTILLLITIYIPLIGIVVNLFLPIPFILFSARSDLKSITVFVITSLVISFIFGVTIGLPITLMYGLLGTIMGYLLQKNKSRTFILISSSLFFLLSTVILYAVSSIFFHFNIIDELLKTFHDSLNTSANMLKGMGQQQQSKQMLEQYEKGLSLIRVLIPSVFVLYSFITVMIIQTVSMPILKRFGINLGSWKSFREMRLPSSLVWYLLLSMAASLFLHPAKGTYIYNALANLTCILSISMLIQGFSFVFYFFYHRGVKKTIPVIIVVFSLVMPVLLYIIGILGIIDLGFDLRSRLNQKD